MSVVTYNDITLPYAQITQFSQEALGDDKGDTDWCYTKFDITVQCVLNANYLALVAPDLIRGDGSLATTNASDIMAVIRSRLLQRRRAFSMTFNGAQLIPESAGGVPGTVDARNGPIPKSCDVRQLTNTTFLMTYNIVAHYWENNDVSQNNPIVKNKKGSQILYNRWSETVDFDHCQYTKRTRQGKFIIRSDNQEGNIADQVRQQMAIVGVPPGFLRESSHYTVSPDGLGIEYTIVDREVFKLPPAPAFESEGYYRESTTHAVGTIRSCECRVKLKGDKFTDQSALITKAIGIASNKLFTRSKQLGGRNAIIRILEASLEVNLYKNEVEYVAIYMMSATPERLAEIGEDPINGVAGFAGIKTDTPLSDGVTTPPKYFGRGTASLLLKAAAYFDPNLLNQQLMPDTGTAANTLVTRGYGAQQFGVGLEVGQAGNEKEA